MREARGGGGSGPPPVSLAAAHPIERAALAYAEIAAYIVSRRGLHSISARWAYDGVRRDHGLHSISARPTYDGGRSSDRYAPPLAEEEAAAQAAARVPSPIWDALFEFQKEGVGFALRHGGRCMIADEMGLGKTVQAICASLCYRAGARSRFT